MSKEILATLIAIGIFYLGYIVGWATSSKLIRAIRDHEHSLWLQSEKWRELSDATLAEVLELRERLSKED